MGSITGAWREGGVGDHTVLPVGESAPCTIYASISILCLVLALINKATKRGLGLLFTGIV